MKDLIGFILIIWLIFELIYLTGCEAQLDYPKNRLNNQIVNAQNLCLDHGGVDQYRFHINEDKPFIGPLIGVNCMDEKYFVVDKELQQIATK
jgi:hypothetical protein